MYRFVIGTLNSAQIDGALIDAVYRLRHRVFKERLNWDVHSVDGREVDEFDDENTVYVIAQNTATGEVDAAWRLRPTTHPYMLKDTFPQLLNGFPPPRERQVWEVSRFAVDQDAGAQGGSSFSELTQDLVAHTVAYAREQGIERYVWVTSVGVERMALGLGYRLRRFGRPVPIGNVRCVANEIVMDEKAFEIANRRLDRTLDPGLAIAA